MEAIDSSHADQWTKWCPLFGKLSIFKVPSDKSITESLAIRSCINFIKDARTIWGCPIREYATSLPTYSDIPNYPARKIIAARAIRVVLCIHPKLILFGNQNGHDKLKSMSERAKDLSGINKSWGFINEEFNTPLTIERLGKEIGSICGLNCKSPANSLEWLNEVLRTSNFFDILTTRKQIVKVTQDVQDLMNKTQDYRNKSFFDLTNYEKNDIEKLNRLLLETTYPNETPKMSLVSDAEVFALLTIHLAYNVSYLMLKEGKSVEDPSVEGQLIGASESLMIAKQFGKTLQGQQQTEQEPPHDKAKQAEFTMPPGAKWNEVKISFIDDQNVSISIRGKTVRKNYAEMGFKDQRTCKPVKSWNTLLSFSEKECLKYSQVIKSKTEKDIQDLRKRLKAYFGIQDDPIALEHGYRPVFQVCRSERDARSVSAYSNSSVIDEKKAD